MKEVKAIKYLGDWVSVDLKESVHQTVLKRISVAKYPIYELRAIVSDARAEALGGINIAFSIFDAAIISMLLHNAETWCNITKKTLKVLTDFFNSFFRCILRVSSGCPIPNLYWQTGSIQVEYLVLQKKLMFYHHLANLPSNTLAREIFEKEVEVANEVSGNTRCGIVSECKEHIDRIGIKTEVSKAHWKKEIQKIYSGVE